MYKVLGIRHTLYSIPNTRLRGFSLIETIVYIAIFASISVLAVNLFLVMSKSFAEVKANRIIMNSGAGLSDRILRDIRSASSIDQTSTFGSSPGILKLNVPDGGGGTDAVRYQISNGSLHLYIDNVDQGAITAAGISVTSLTFWQITTTAGAAVRFSATLTTNNLPVTRTETFYGTATLRRAY